MALNENWVVKTATSEFSSQYLRNGAQFTITTNWKSIGTSFDVRE